jgi:hypothetical protein
MDYDPGSHLKANRLNQRINGYALGHDLRRVGVSDAARVYVFGIWADAIKEQYRC